MKIFLIILVILSLFLASTEVFAETVEINLEEGWNLVSIPLQLQDASPTQVLSSISGQYRDVWQYNSGDSNDPWKHYHPAYNSFNDLHTIELNNGYWIYVRENTTLSIAGNPITTNQTISLKQGWNLIGWPYLYAQPIPEALSSLTIGVDYNQVSRHNSSGWEDYFNSPATDDFDNLEPGKAYYIYCLRSCTLTLEARHSPKLGLIGNKSVSEGKELKFIVTANDADPEDVLTYFASNLPLGASFDNVTQTFTWTPDFTQAGEYPDILFEVTDGIFVDRKYITISVVDVNQPPVLDSIGDQSIREGELLEFKVLAHDIDGDELTYETANLPEGASFNRNTHVFSWRPDFIQAGTYPDVHFEVSDSSFIDSEDITITVLNSNQAPTLESLSCQSVKEDDVLEFSVTARDPDGDSLVYSAFNLPPQAAFDGASRLFSWRPGHNDIGRHKVVFSVTDGEFIASETVTIMVDSFNQVAAYEHLVERMDVYSSSGPRLIETYMDPYPLKASGNPILVGQAFVYDNALAILTLLSRGFPEDIERAKLISQALMDLQNNDTIGDGRIKDFYDATILPHIDSHARTYTGNMAWVMMAWLQYYKNSGDEDGVFLDGLLAAAERLGNFVITNLRDDSQPGFFIGFESEGDTEPRDIKSTEHNIDLYAAFMHLYEVTGSVSWKDAADWAKAYVISKFNGEFFTAGTGDEYVEDVNSWAILALGQVESFRSAISWVEANMGVMHHGFRGFDFDTDKDGVWFEGTGHMALAYQVVGRKGSSNFYCEELRRAQKQAMGNNGKAIVAACHTRNEAGEVDGVSAIWFDFFASPHISSTCWFILAERGINPFWGTAADEPIPHDPEELIQSQATDGKIPSPRIFSVTSPTNIPIQTIYGRKARDTSIWVNGKELMPMTETESFSYTILLNEGENTFRFTARDKEGRGSDPVSVTIVLDTIAPSISIISPKDGFLTNNSTIVVSGTIDRDGVMVEVDGRLGKITNSSFTANRIWLIEGLNTITATVIDRAGNMSRDIISVTLDTQAPSRPELDPFLSLTSVPVQTLSGTKEPNSSIWLNGKEIVPNHLESTWSYEILLREGGNNLTFTSKDELGNESEPNAITIELDTQKPDRPTINKVSSPTNLKTQTITGTRSVDTEKIELVSSKAIIGSVVYPTDTTWTCEVTLQEGGNRLTVFAQDLAGNRVMGDDITVILDTTPPLFEVLYPRDGSYINGKE